MSKALKRAAEVTAVITDFRRGSGFLATWLADLGNKTPERFDAALSYPTLALRVEIKEGVPTGQIDLYDRSRPMPKMRETDLRIPIDSIYEHEVTARDVKRFLDSKIWLDAVANRQTAKMMIADARACARLAERLA